MTAHYNIGIDGGGTRSRLIAVRADGSVLGRYEGGSTNLASNSTQAVHAVLQELTTAFFADCGTDAAHCAGFCIGSAGVDLEPDRAAMEGLIRQLGFTCPVRVVNDSVIALAAATRGGPGVVVISGTGSIAMGMDAHGTFCRAGGWGHIVDDEGSAYWLGRAALRAALHGYDGRGGPTALADCLTAALGIAAIPDSMEFLYGTAGSKAAVAALAPCVEQCAKRGDAVAEDLLRQAARGLYRLANAVLSRLDNTGIDCVTVSGGTIANSGRLFQYFEALLAERTPPLRAVQIEEEPLMGAVYLARSAAVGAPDK